VVAGPPENLVKNPLSFTGKFLAKYLRNLKGAKL